MASEAYFELSQRVDAVVSTDPATGNCYLRLKAFGDRWYMFDPSGTAPPSAAASPTGCTMRKARR